MRQGTDIKFASPGQQDSVQFICINQVRGVTLFFSCRRYHQPLFVSHVKVSQGTNSGWERLVEPGPHPPWLGGAAQPAPGPRSGAGHTPSPGSHQRTGWWQDRYQHQRRPNLGWGESAATHLLQTAPHLLAAGLGARGEVSSAKQILGQKKTSRGCPQSQEQP